MPRCPPRGPDRSRLPRTSFRGRSAGSSRCPRPIRTSRPTPTSSSWRTNFPISRTRSPPAAASSTTLCRNTTPESSSCRQRCLQRRSASSARISSTSAPAEAKSSRCRRSNSDRPIMAAYGLYTHIASNRFRSMLLLAGLFLLIYVLVFAGALIAEVVLNGDGSVDYYLRAALHDLIKSFAYAPAGVALWIMVAYFFHQSIIDAVTGGQDVSRQQQPRLYNLLENLCISRGIPMPKLKIMDSEARNAFATGLNPRQYSITVTTGLLNALDDQEIEAVLGHELTHIRNGDVQLMVVAVIIAGVVGFTAELFFRLFFNSNWS